MNGQAAAVQRESTDGPRQHSWPRACDRVVSMIGSGSGRALVAARAPLVGNKVPDRFIDTDSDPLEARWGRWATISR